MDEDFYARLLKVKLWSKINIQEQEEYRLVKEIEQARKGLVQAQSWRIAEADGEEGVHSQIPIMLTELRYRYLLRQARKRNIFNRWFYELQEDGARGR